MYRRLSQGESIYLSTRWEKIELFFLLLHCRNLYKILSGLCRYFWAHLHARKSGGACPLINCVPSLFYIDTKGCFVGWGILFLHHMFGFYSGKAVVFTFLGLVCICQWPNGFLALPSCSSNYTNAPVKLKWLCLWTLSESILLLKNEALQVFRISVFTWKPEKWTARHFTRCLMTLIFDYVAGMGKMLLRLNFRAWFSVIGSSYEPDIWFSRRCIKPITENRKQFRAPLIHFVGFLRDPFHQRIMQVMLAFILCSLSLHALLFLQMFRVVRAQHTLSSRAEFPSCSSLCGCAVPARM